MAPKRPADQAAAVHKQSHKRARLQRGRTITSGSSTPTAGKGSAPGGKGKADPLGGANAAALRTMKSKLEGLPPAVQVEKFALARSFEIQAMKKAMKNSWDSNTKRAFQTLPRHLRRRAASHNARRVPSRLRAKATAEIDPKTKKKKHFPRKKVTRKAGLSLTERYRRRQRTKLWLDTHIWMAKRMHMVNVWGFRLAHRPTAKAFRPSHRAAIRSSILNDVSYFSLLELKGPAPALREILKGICGEICWGKRFEDGARMAETTFYRQGQWPQGFLTPAQVMWRPLPASSGSESSEFEPIRQLWIRFHPSTHASIFSTLRGAIPHALSQPAFQCQDVKVELNDVRESVCVFELTGPKSGKVLKGALGELVRDEPREEIKTIWKELPDIASPGSVPRGMVLGLRTYDPRLHFPPQNIKPSAETRRLGTPIFSHHPSATLAESELWNPHERSSLAKRKFKKVELDQRRAKLGIPGSRLRAEVDDARLPLLLVQQTLSPEISSSPLASPPTSAMHGYLLFHPRGWSQPLLHSLVFTGTRIGGIREREAQAFESGAGCWPRDFVGSEQGALWWNAKAKEDKFTWDRKPPAKRPNYLKHGWEAVDLTLTESRLPWKPDWPGVVAGYPVDARMADEEAAINDAASLAAQPFLLHLPAFSDVLVSLLQASEPAVVLLDAVNQHRLKRGLPALPPTAAPKLLEAAMVRVSVEMLARGVAGDVGPIFSLADDPVGLEEERLWRSSYGGGRKGRDVDHEAESTVTIPPKSSIIGYLTSGSFSLARGHGFALGGIPLTKLLSLFKRDLAAGRLLIAGRPGQTTLKVSAGALVGLVKVQKREGGVARAALIQIAG